MTEPDPDFAIAIVGMAGRFPGLADPAGLDAVLAGTEDLLTRFPGREGRVHGYGIAPYADEFDAVLFGLSDVEARRLDPQHRVLLECVWEALEDAGVDPAAFPGPIGLYAGVGETEHPRDLLAAYPDLGGPEFIAATSPTQLIGRIAWTFGLTGPATAVQSGCATSLVATHLAVQALVAGECDLALAGAATVFVPEHPDAEGADGSISSDGRLRALDVAATGVVPSNGAGVLALRRLEDATAAGDRIHAVIRSSALANDGAGRPDPQGHGRRGFTDSMRAAYRLAGVDLATIEYVDVAAGGSAAHTAYEIAALRSVFAGVPAGSCRLGSVKAYLGHTDTAVAVLATIAVARAMATGTLPGVPGLLTPDPEADDPAGPFTVSAEPAPWPRRGHPRRAGLSSFGDTGTAGHLVLEEPPEPAPRPEPPGPQALLLSARTPQALRALAARLADHLRRTPLSLADVAYTLQEGRRPLVHRAAVVATDPAAAIAGLADLEIHAATGELGATADPDATPAEAARLWTYGVPVEWARFRTGPAPRRVGLPTYPFERRRYRLDEPGPGPKWSLSRRPRPEAPVRLYCFPHAGGLPGDYMSWSDHLPDVEVRAVQLPGRGGRAGEPHAASVQDAAAAFLAAEPMSAPYVLLGHSFGAILALEVARGLAAAGRPAPLGLILSGHPAPERAEPEITGVAGLGDAELADRIGEFFGPLPAEIRADPDLLALALDSVRTDLALLEAYRWTPGPPLTCPIVVTGGTADTPDPDALRAWAGHTGAGLRLRLFPGGHFFFRDDPAAWFGFLATTVHELVRTGGSRLDGEHAG